ncbi:hypothetical protein BTO02_09945 [Paraburkholderia sp. SOS3]|nr:hypothetical protein BTO02_09945 [Paraburkholderia sp. SOS3]
MFTKKAFINWVYHYDLNLVIRRQTSIGPKHRLVGEAFIGLPWLAESFSMPVAVSRMSDDCSRLARPS